MVDIFESSLTNSGRSTEASIGESGMCQCQADMATRPRLARHGPARVPTWPDTVRHGSAWRGLAWQIEVRSLANRSEGLASRSEGLAHRSEGLANRSEGLGGRAGPGPVDKSEGLGWPGGLGPVIKVRGWAGRAWQIEVRGLGPARPGTVRHGPITVRHGPSRSGTEHPCSMEALSIICAGRNLCNLREFVCKPT